MPRWTNGLLWKTITYILGLYHKWSICWAQQGSNAQLLHNVIPSRAWWTEVMSPSINQLRILHVGSFFFGGDFKAARQLCGHWAGHNFLCPFCVRPRGKAGTPLLKFWWQNGCQFRCLACHGISEPVIRTTSRKSTKWLRLRIFGHTLW